MTTEREPEKKEVTAWTPELLAFQEECRRRVQARKLFDWPKNPQQWEEYENERAGNRAGNKQD